MFFLRKKRGKQAKCKYSYVEVNILPILPLLHLACIFGKFESMNVWRELKIKGDKSKKFNKTSHVTNASKALPLQKKGRFFVFDSIAY